MEQMEVVAGPEPQVFSPVPIGDLIREWIEVRELRLENERIAEQLRKGPEAEAKRAIMEYLAVTGQKGAKVSGLGTVTRTASTEVWLKDAEKACAYMLENFTKARAAGTPLANHLALQKRAAKNELLGLAKGRIAAAGGDPEDLNELNRALNPLGFEVAPHEDLHFAKDAKR